MCTVIVSVDPASPVPLLLVGVRDEFRARAWLEPGRHWSHRPTLIGGLDLQAGGTWLAVDPVVPRVAAILNAFGLHAPEEGRLSRGELPLLVASGGSLASLDLPRYDPFHLVEASLSAVTVSTWNGHALIEHTLGAGLHFVVNSGVEGNGTTEDAPPGAVEDMAARLDYFRPLLAAAPRPVPLSGSSASSASAWGQWLPIVDGNGLDRMDPRALVLRRDFPDRGIWGTNSISLLGLRPDGVRYDFSADPGSPGHYAPVDQPQ